MTLGSFVENTFSIGEILQNPPDELFCPGLIEWYPCVLLGKDAKFDKLEEPEEMISESIGYAQPHIIHIRTELKGGNSASFLVLSSLAFMAYPK